MTFIQGHKTFASTEGSWVEQEIIETGCGLTATAVSDGEVQVRSYLNALGRHQMTRGYEFIEQVDLNWSLSRYYIGAG